MRKGCNKISNQLMLCLRRLTVRPSSFRRDQRLLPYSGAEMPLDIKSHHTSSSQVPGMREELMEGACVGAQGTVSKSGWSNSTVFMDYLQKHLSNMRSPAQMTTSFSCTTGTDRTYHRTWWTGLQKTVSCCFVLPPHTSHVLQPMDVGCFGAFFKDIQ